jgi:hypothetical protein
MGRYAPAEVEVRASSRPGPRRTVDHQVCPCCPLNHPSDDTVEELAFPALYGTSFEQIKFREQRFGRDRAGNNAFEAAGTLNPYSIQSSKICERSPGNVAFCQTSTGMEPAFSSQTACRVVPALRGDLASNRVPCNFRYIRSDFRFRRGMKSIFRRGSVWRREKPVDAAR